MEKGIKFSVENPIWRVRTFTGRTKPVSNRFRDQFYDLYLIKSVTVQSGYYTFGLPSNDNRICCFNCCRQSKTV